MIFVSAWMNQYLIQIINDNQFGELFVFDSHNSNWCVQFLWVFIIDQIKRHSLNGQNPNNCKIILLQECTGIALSPLLNSHDE
jgi:hypothetical protein